MCFSPGSAEIDLDRTAAPDMRGTMGQLGGRNSLSTPVPARGRGGEQGAILPQLSYLGMRTPLFMMPLGSIIFLISSIRVKEEPCSTGA